jgi:hypothetical protein
MMEGLLDCTSHSSEEDWEVDRSSSGDDRAGISYTYGQSFADGQHTAWRMLISEEGDKLSEKEFAMSVSMDDGKAFAQFLDGTSKGLPGLRITSKQSPDKLHETQSQIKP